MNNYYGPLPGPWKGLMQMRSPEASDSLVDYVFVLQNLLVPIPFRNTHTHTHTKEPNDVLLQQDGAPPLLRI